jgi:TonB family protein
MKRALLLSIFLHTLVACFFLWGPQAKNSLRSPSSETPTLQTRTLSEDELAREFPHSRQIVQTDDQIKTQAQPHAHQEVFLGRHNQRVDNNTRAARVGEFKNVLKEGLKDARDLFKLSPSENTFAKDSEELPAAQGETMSFAQRAPAAHIPDGPSGEGFSATDDYLPHVAIGANTLLNTREYKYASFYERIREKLNHQWQRLVQSEMEGLYLQGVRRIEGERITKLRIELDEKGFVTNIERYGSAGYRELDRAAIKAFEIAGPFPNPPQELLKEDGAKVKIDWHFVVLSTHNMAPRVSVKRMPAGF